MKLRLLVVFLLMVFVVGCAKEVVIVPPEEKPAEIVPVEVPEAPEEVMPEEVVEEPAEIPEEEEVEYVEDLCPEQVLLGFKKCSEAEDGIFIVEIRNVAYADLVSMVFYLYYENEKVGETEVRGEFIAGTEKAYSLDFPALENAYGTIDKIEATPVIITDDGVLRCANKKLSFTPRNCR